MIPEYGKLMPHAIDAEEAVLGALMVTRDAIGTISALINSEDFYTEQHQHIFAAAWSLYSKGQAVDLLTVRKEMQSMAFQPDAMYLANLTNRVASAAHIESHCRIIKEQSIRRQLISIMTKAIKESFDDSKDPFESLNNVELLCSNIKASMAKGSKQTKQQIAEALIAHMTKGDSTGTELTGITELDLLLGKGEPGEVILVAARPGMGKSMLANTMVKQVAFRLKKKLKLWGLEMTNVQSMRRLISNLAHVEYNTLKTGNVDMDSLAPWIKQVIESSLEFEDQAGVNAMDIRSGLISEQKQKGLDMAIIDHGRLIAHMNLKNTTDSSEIGKTTRLLKQTAKDLNIPLVLLWQLNRDVEKRAGCIPRLSDLRDGGSLEEDADKIIFLYRPEYYNYDNYKHYDNVKGLAIAMVQKHRDGELGEVPMYFNPTYMRFETWRSDQPFSGNGAPVTSKQAEQSDIPF